MNKKDLCLSVLFVLSVGYIPFNAFGSVTNQILCLIAVFCSLFSSLRGCVLQMAFFLPFVSVTAFPMFGINFHAISMIEMVLLLKVFREGFFTVSKNGRLFIVCALIPQLYPLLFCYQELGNVIKLVLDILLFIGLFNLVKNEVISKNDVMLFLTFGILVSCVTGLFYDNPDTGMYDSDVSYDRYKGLWTDPNFLGMFCLIGMATCISIDCASRWGKLMNYAIAGALLYFGSLTMSRTFLVVLVLLFAIYALTVLRTSVWAVVAFTLVGIFLVPLFFELVDNVASVRMDSEGGLANGRLNRTMIVLDVMESRIPTLLSGIGFNNLAYLPNLGYMLTATHNTYADIFTQFGIIFSALLVAIACSMRAVVGRLARSLFSMEGLPLFILMIYGGTLSLLPYEFTYVLVAVLVVEQKAKVEI